MRSIVGNRYAFCDPCPSLSTLLRLSDTWNAAASVTKTTMEMAPTALLIMKGMLQQSAAAGARDMGIQEDSELSLDLVLTVSRELLVVAEIGIRHAEVLAVERHEEHGHRGDVQHLEEDDPEPAQEGDGPDVVELLVLERVGDLRTESRL